VSTLSPERWREISPHLDHALSLDEKERAAWLESFATESPELAGLIRELLLEHGVLSKEKFLEIAPESPVSETSLVGQKIGPYTLLSPVGQGGMGSVWLAERSDGRFERKVAVEFLHFSVAAHGGVERFRREGRILAQLAHPHIAELLDAGVTAGGEPYLVLEYVDGDPITDYCDRNKLDLKFLSTIMWDGRETVFGAIPGKSIDLNQSLMNQAKDATTGHAQGLVPSAQQVAQIVAFETGVFSAQANDQGAGSLTAQGALGGPVNLSQQNTFVGINDSLGGDPTGATFDPNVFTLYGAWANAGSPYRQSVARGENLFNNLPIPITGVGGLNDALNQPVIMGTCTTCHDGPNAGNHSFSVPLAIGTTAYPAMPALDVAGLPVYTIRCIATGVTVQVTDPGRAMVSGKCKDIGKLKGPVLRGLAARAPYFHNGAAATLDDAVEFYDQRFNLNLTQQQKADLVAFLKTL